MTTQEAQQYLVSQLYTVYDNSEAANISDWVLEHITGWKKMDRVVNKSFHLTVTQQNVLKQMIAELLQHRPVQYVLGEAWFYGMKFYVNEGVLIPRPETEELVEWIINDVKENTTFNSLSIFDIGSGSGCIPIALKKYLPKAKIESCDVSNDALGVARKNASDLNVEVLFRSLNILDENARNALGKYNVIVSNPPYIPSQEKNEMDKHVVDFEPHLALFVEDNDPLIFYKAIVELAKKHLVQNGAVYLETHTNLANEVAGSFNGEQFMSVEIKKDLQGKNRMVKAVKVSDS